MGDVIANMPTSLDGVIEDASGAAHSVGTG